MLTRKTTFIVAALLVTGVAAPAFAQVGRMVDPDSLAPAAREYALHGKLYDRDPLGNPASPGCLWSRIQVPTAQGLRWMAKEECQPSDGPP